MHVGIFKKKWRFPSILFRGIFTIPPKKKWFALNIFTAKEDQIARNLLTLVVGGSTKFSLPSTMQSMGEGNGLRPGSLLRSSWGGRAFAFYYLYIYILFVTVPRVSLSSDLQKSLYVCNSEFPYIHMQDEGKRFIRVTNIQCSGAFMIFSYQIESTANFLVTTY